MLTLELVSFSGKRPLVDSRKNDRKRGSLAWRAFNGELATDVLDDRAADREPKAGAAWACRL